MGAALAFYTVFSIGPLLLLATGIAGLVFGHEAVRGELAAQFTDLIGEEGARAVESWVASSGRMSTGVWATITGAVVLLVGATGAFAELHSALNRVWGVESPRYSGVLGMLRARLLSFGMVFVIGFLLLVSLAVSAVLAAVNKFFAGYVEVPAFALRATDWLTSLGMTTLLFALIFKVIPDARTRWRDVAVGALLTAALFTLGKVAIGVYLGRMGALNSFGASASIPLFMMWTYYSALILFFGAEFTEVLSRRAAPPARLHPVPSGSGVAVALAAGTVVLRSVS